jgi:1-deoxy-D-xylulose-5-phosphate reductoisomerase
MTRPLRVAVLGSTGSIGLQTLDVARRHPERVRIVALAANKSASVISKQAAEFGVRYVALADEASALEARRILPPSVDIGAGDDAVVDLAALSEADIVLNALVGAAGLRATVAALQSGKKLALANKESLVVGGEFVMAMVAEGQLLPVDSEHSAIFQCYLGEDARDVARIWLTASGGPFRGRSRDELRRVTAVQALAHPTWNMGPKITVDSASLMNKGLEVIEAHHLFGVGIDDVRVLVHPQSCIHSMVEFADGSVKAHLGATDMRIPIQYAFSHPRRWEAPLPPVDFAEIGRLDFMNPDLETFGCLRLALEAGREAGTAPAVLNAANEVAVAAFLAGECGFLDIESTVAAVLDGFDIEPLSSVAQIESVDVESRRLASDWLRRLPG